MRSRLEQHFNLLDQVFSELNEQSEHLIRVMWLLSNKHYDQIFMSFLWVLAIGNRTTFENESTAGEDDPMDSEQILKVLFYSLLFLRLHLHDIINAVPNENQVATNNIDTGLDSSDEFDNEDDTPNIHPSYANHHTQEFNFLLENLHRQYPVSGHTHYQTANAYSPWNMDSRSPYSPQEDVITSENHDLLVKTGIPENWIPDSYKCPITSLLIDGTPVAAPVTPDRFDFRALLKWLKENQTNPLNRDILLPHMLDFDYILECKIRVFVEWVCANSTTLKSISPVEAKQKVSFLVEKIENIYEKLFKNHKSLITYTNKITQTIKEKAMLHESSKALILFNKEPERFKPITAFKLNIAQNRFQFYKSEASRPLSQRQVKLHEPSKALIPLKKGTVRFKPITSFKPNIARNQFQFYKPEGSQSLSKHQDQRQDKYVDEFINLYGSCYELLNIPATATGSEIVKAYKQLSLSIHPDKNSNIDTTEKFKQLTSAKDILIDEELRDLHDVRTLQLLSREGVGWSK